VFPIGQGMPGTLGRASLNLQARNLATGLANMRSMGCARQPEYTRGPCLVETPQPATDSSGASSSAAGLVPLSSLAAGVASGASGVGSASSMTAAMQRKLTFNSVGSGASSGLSVTEGMQTPGLGGIWAEGQPSLSPLSRVCAGDSWASMPAFVGGQSAPARPSPKGPQAISGPAATGAAGTARARPELQGMECEAPEGGRKEVPFVAQKGTLEVGCC
jgi:hypothetical protein